MTLHPGVPMSMSESQSLRSLLGPEAEHPVGVPVPPDPGDREDGREVYLMHPPASSDDTASRFVADIVSRLFAATLSLDSARRMVGDGPGGDRIAVAVDQIDRAIRDIQTMTFGLAMDRGKRPRAAGADE